MGMQGDNRVSKDRMNSELTSAKNMQLHAQIWI